MNFRRGRGRDEPEINFIPLIDLLLVILIFLMVTTTYSRFSEMQINLPTATADVSQQKSDEIAVAVSAQGDVKVGETILTDRSPQGMTDIFKRAAAGKRQPVVVINADAKSTHQSVINVMEAARNAGLTQLTFATQTAEQ